jgi:integrase
VLVRLAVVSGSRRGELLALRWEDVKGSTLVVARSVVGAEGSLTIKATKTERTKVIALDAETVRIVAAWRAESEAQADSLEVGLSELMFPQRPGESLPWWPDTLSSRWRALADQHGLEGVRFHDLRHTMVTTLISAGVDPRTVADRAGHSSPVMTLDNYSHAVPARDVDAAELLGRLLDDGGRGVAL